jgi:hypothetical protein
MAKSKVSKVAHDPGKSTFWILKIYFIIALLLVGLDKFFYEMSNWSTYICPFALQLFSCQDRPLMGIAGLIEILIALGLIFWPRVFSYFLCAWLLLGIVNFLIGCRHFDLALWNVGLFLAAFCLGGLSMKYSGKHHK